MHHADSLDGAAVLHFYHLLKCAEFVLYVYALNRVEDKKFDLSAQLI